MKMLQKVLIAGLLLVGCSDGFSISITQDAGIDATESCTKQLAASVHGGNWKSTFGIQPPAAMDTTNLRVWLDDSVLPTTCWRIDANRVVNVNKAVFPDDNVHSLFFSADCLVVAPADTSGMCASW